MSLMPPDPITEEDLRDLGSHDAARAVRSIQGLAGQGVTDDDLAPLHPLLLHALRACPDPDRALHSFARWFAAVGSPYSHLQMLLRHPVALDLFCLVTGSSQYFADLLARQPEYFEIIANPGVRGGTKTGSRFYRDVSALVDACQRPELKKDVLRRWKAREMLRIGVRDLVGLADMPSTAREFSNLADACVQKALDIAVTMLPMKEEEGALPHPRPLTETEKGETSPPAAFQSGEGSRSKHSLSLKERAGVRLAELPRSIPFCVIAMGKLGGQELNYSSDIDLMFTHGDNLPAEIVLADGRRMEAAAYLTRLAETIVKVLAEDTANGHVFRVDMRLRPEGRFGPLTRSLSGFRAYYESWAEGWERQALIKARVIAGDRALGEAFMTLITPFVYRPRVSETFLEEVRANKRRIEQKCALEGQALTNIKTGFGGIRDVEFLVQLLQLQFGGMHSYLRTPNTLSAIQRLHHAAHLTGTEARELAEDYQFLRNLEHRLQLLNGFQTQTMPPAGAVERLHLSRRMGFVHLEAFEAELEQRRNRVRSHLEQRFYTQHATPDIHPPIPEESKWRNLGALLDNLASPAAQEQLTGLLQSAGFQDIPAALRAFQLPMSGNEFGGMPPDTPEEFKAIVPRLMTLLEHSPDPDAGLAGIEAMALAVPNRAQLYASFDDSPEVMARLVQLAAASPPLLKRLARHQEWMETLFAESETDNTLPTDLPNRKSKVESRTSTEGAKAFESKLDHIARAWLRESLQIAARDIWNEDEVIETMQALSRLAGTTLQALLDVCKKPLIIAHPDGTFARSALDRVAVIGLGKLGGMELGYASDWDVVFVYDTEGRREDSERSAERFGLVNSLVERMITAVKALAMRGANIEMDLRLRPWGRKGALIYSLRGFIEYYRHSGETWERQAALKARYVAGNPTAGHRFEWILRAVSFGRGVTPEEAEAVTAMKRRIENERLKPSERDADLKLGYGGLSDIEWLVQKLQLQHGPRLPEIRQSNTLRALAALNSAHLLDHAESDILAVVYCLLTRLRNALWLQTGAGQDALPADPLRFRALARRLGYSDTVQEAAEQRLREDVLAHTREVRRIFQQRFYEG